jgi:threonylcarbamoyladenosine tRNA methylthiotransferase MtaB
MKVFFDTVGCRLNQAEIEKMAAEFRAAGHQVVDEAAQADLVIVNTCAVTAAAASDSRQKVRQAEKVGVENIVLTGCWATLNPTEAALLPGVKAVFSNDEKKSISEKVLGRASSLFELEPLQRNPLPGVHRRTRAFIKAQDGCNNHCTFCVTRLARGEARSESKGKILEQVLSAEAGHTQEIVLTGVHLGWWGRDLSGHETITDLAKYILDKSQIKRLRFSSIEPWELEERFFELWQNKRVCRHLHFPLQSGSAGTLRRMVRNTTPAEYRELVRKIRDHVPEMAITTDIIVGFAGETDEEFSESLAFVKEMEFAGGHVFRYSPREGTAAVRLPGRVNGKTAHARSEAIRDVLAESEQIYRARFLGEIMTVLWESNSFLSAEGWRLHGLTDNYLPISAWSKDNRWNMTDQVKLVNLQDETIKGEILF